LAELTDVIATIPTPPEQRSDLHRAHRDSDSQCNPTASATPTIALTPEDAVVRVDNGRPEGVSPYLTFRPDDGSGNMRFDIGGNTFSGGVVPANITPNFGWIVFSGTGHELTVVNEGGNGAQR